MPTSPFDVALDVRATLGECPVWSTRDRALYFVDIKGATMHRFDPATRSHRAVVQPEEIGCIGVHRDGGFIAGTRSGLWRLDATGLRREKLADNPEDTAESRFNDGRCDPAGRFLAGTLDEPKTGARAHLYRYDHRGLATLIDGLTTSNGLAFSPDGRTMYHSDTPRYTIWAWDYDRATGAIENRRVFASLDPSAADRGRPDGAAVDSTGCYWVSLFEGGRVQRYDPKGALMAEYPVPGRCPTMPAFGGDDLKTLFVTSARVGRSAEELADRPHSGSLFAMAVDEPGQAEPMFDPTA